MILIADIGGTNTKVGLLSSNNLHKFQDIRTYKNSEYNSFQSIIKPYLSQYEIEEVILGIAGPKIDNRIIMTNLDWEFDEIELERVWGCSVQIFNDLEMIAMSIPHISRDTIIPITTEAEIANGNSTKNVVVGLGTGLGVAVGIENEYSTYLPTEAGHISFTPFSKIESDLVDYLNNSIDGPHSLISWEMVCSGIGIDNLCKFIISKNPFDFESEFIENLNAAKEKSKFIFNQYYKKEEFASESRQIIEFIARLLGGYLRLVSLIYLPDNIYITGGIGRRLADFSTQIITRYSLDQKMKHLLSSINISIISDENIALHGPRYMQIDQS